MLRMPRKNAKAYLLNTQAVLLRWQSLLDAILEADGITKEMMQRKRPSSNCSSSMLEATDIAAQEALIREHTPI